MPSNKEGYYGRHELFILRNVFLSLSNNSQFISRRWSQSPSSHRILCHIIENVMLCNTLYWAIPPFPTFALQVNWPRWHKLYATDYLSHQQIFCLDKIPPIVIFYLAHLEDILWCICIVVYNSRLRSGVSDCMKSTKLSFGLFLHCNKRIEPTLFSAYYKTKHK